MQDGEENKQNKHSKRMRQNETQDNSLSGNKVKEGV